MRKIFVHLHIPKCGGSTIVDFLKRNFGSNLGSTNSILNDYQYDASQVVKIIRHYPSLKCLTGHKLSLDLPFSDPNIDIQALTWIRDPIDRFVSHYFFHRNHTTLVPEAKTMNLLDYTEWALGCGNQQMYINGQTKFLSGGSLEIVESMVTDGKLMLFPLSRLQQSFYTLSNNFPEIFTDIKVDSKNISKKDQVIPAGFRSLILPYVEKDLTLLELANQTPLKTEMSQRSPHQSKESNIVRDLAMRSSRFLQRAAKFIENRC